MSQDIKRCYEVTPLYQFTQRTPFCCLFSKVHFILISQHTNMNQNLQITVPWSNSQKPPYDSYILQRYFVTLKVIACVAGVRKGRGRELGRDTTREGGVPFLSPLRAKIPPSPFNACHAGY